MQVEKMKKVLKLIVAIILALAIIGGVSFLVDCSSINSGKEPILCKELNIYKDGGTKEYIGLGYKIIDFNMLNGFDEIKIGSWFMKYDDFEDEFKAYDNKEIDNVNSNIGENILSGDNNILSGEVTSGDISFSGDKNDITQNQTSGDLTNGKDNETSAVSGDIISGDNQIKDDKKSFIATIIGINGNTMVVSPLEDELIRASSDMISFGIGNLNNEENKNYLIGQKVKVTYDGEVMETYPAQIKAVSLEIVE